MPPDENGREPFRAYADQSTQLRSVFGKLTKGLRVLSFVVSLFCLALAAVFFFGRHGAHGDLEEVFVFLLFLAIASFGIGGLLLQLEALLLRRRP